VTLLIFMQQGRQKPAIKIRNEDELWSHVVSLGAAVLSPGLAGCLAHPSWASAVPASRSICGPAGRK
jgi:hypothetical protein